MKKTTQDKLRAEWHGPFSADHVARRHHLAVSTVRNFWNDEKKAGRLPSLPCRPAFAASNPPPEPPAPPEPTAALDEIDFDDCDQVFGVVPLVDPLVAALKREHGFDKRRRAERDAADVLEIAEMKFDPAVMRNGLASRPFCVPSPAFFRRLARRYDREMRALINPKKERRT